MCLSRRSTPGSSTEGPLQGAQQQSPWSVTQAATSSGAATPAAAAHAGEGERENAGKDGRTDPGEGGVLGQGEATAANRHAAVSASWRATADHHIGAAPSAEAHRSSRRDEQGRAGEMLVDEEELHAQWMRYQFQSGRQLLDHMGKVSVHLFPVPDFWAQGDFGERGNSQQLDHMGKVSVNLFPVPDVLALGDFDPKERNICSCWITWAG